VNESFLSQVTGAFAFLVKRHRYTLTTAREPSACKAEPFRVLRYTNQAADRRVELHLQSLPHSRVHYHGALMRLAGGVRPSYYDNENYLSLTRVLAYYKHLDTMAFEEAEVLAKLGFYAEILQKHDGSLKSAHWLDRNTLLDNETELYVFPFERAPHAWIEDVIAFFRELMAGARVDVTLNTNWLPPWEACGDVVELRCEDRALEARLTYGYGAEREAYFRIALRLRQHEIERASQATLPIFLDEIRREIEPLLR
jgi:hypothetical protein